MSDQKKNEGAEETKKHQNRGARGFEEGSQDNTKQFQGEYHEEGKQGIRGNVKGAEEDAGSLSSTAQAHDGKGGIGQNNQGQLNDHDDDYQSGSKGGNRSGKTGSKQGGSRGEATM
jgi:hypothetical protein